MKIIQHKHQWRRDSTHGRTCVICDELQIQGLQWETVTPRVYKKMIFWDKGNDMRKLDEEEQLKTQRRSHF